ncbi:MAG TPA: glycosyltransferase, partial [Nitrospira sp.]|nr:glycosyltransferase [Nitrospira sp.]
ERYTASQDAHQAREQELHDHIQGLDGKMQGLLENQLATEETLRVRQVQLDMSIRMLGVHGRTIARTLGPESCSKGWKGRHKKQVILDSRIFDAGYLAAQVSEFDLAPCELLDRYLSDPQLFKYSPNPLFDGGWYLERNPDVARSGINPLYHYLIHGHREKRSPHPLFDPEFYTHLYPDVLHAGVNPLIHYIRHGGAEGRRPHWLFDAAAYLQQFYQVVEANMTPLEHYCRYGGVISFRPHPYFDPDFYVISYADVLSTGLSPLVHYLRIGAGCGYDPSPEFSTEAYFAAYPETRANAVNPLIHFARQADYKRIFFGHDEGEVLVPPQRVSPQIKLQDIEAEQWSQPTSWLQDYLYEEFGFNERIRILTWLQNFGLPLNSAIKPDIENDNGLDLLANQVSVQARSLPVTDCPDISIIVPVYNQVRYTLACLHSILADKTRYNYEIIVADDNSSDGTPGYFSHGLVNVHHVRSPRNLGFLRNCNNAVNYARGRILVFLNNDTYVLPGWLDNLAGTLDSTAEVGLVGSKLVFADGRLQESGGLIFADGSGWNYGRLDDPRKPEYCYLRDTDYVSGASIAIPRALWDRLGGFSECYEMAYYEDTDLAFKVRDAGLRVVVQPLSQLIHFEGVSSGTDLTTGAKQYQVVNAKIFRQRWAGALASHGHADPAKLPINRNCRGRVLVIDTRTPMPDRDSGSMDTYQYLRMLKSFGFHVIFVPENLVHAGPYSDDLQRIGVETLYTPYWLSFEQIFSTLGPGLDYVLVFRAPLADSLLGLIRHHAPRARFIFDTVDLHFLRLEREAELADDAEKRRDAARMREIELNLMRKADATIVLSSYEMSLLSRLVPEANLHEIPIVRQAPPRSDKGFDERRDVVFVGGFEHTPNVDAVKWFIAEVMPHLQKRRFTGQFVVVGSSMPQEIRDLARPGIVMRGFVPDLEAFFGDIRVSVAPLRYGAGLKGKVISSLSYGVPVVATGVAVEGGGFTHGTDVWVADHPDDIAQAIIRLHEDRSEWEAYSAAGYSFFEDNFSVDVVSRKLATLFLGDTLSSSHNAQKIGQAA